MNNTIKQRLQYLKEEIKHERISYLEIAELQNLAKYIPEQETLLKEWAGIPEYDSYRKEGFNLF